MKTRSAILLFVLIITLLFPQAVSGAPSPYVWERLTLPTGLSMSDIHTFAIHPLDAKTAFLGATNGLYKTANAGDTWALLGGMNGYIFDVIVAPSNPQRMFVRSWQVYRSDNGGDSWGQITPPDGNCGLWVAPSDADRVYALSCPQGTTPSLAKSTDGGKNWDSYATPFTEYFGTLAIAPNNPDILIATTFDSAYRSADGGQTWTPLPVGTRYNAKPVFNPRSPYTLYLGHWTGLLRSTDGGQTWEDSGTDREFTSLIVSPMNSAEVLGGNNTASWSLLCSSATWDASAWNAPQPLNGLWRSVSDSSVLYARTSDSFWRYRQGNPLSKQVFLPVITNHQDDYQIPAEAQTALERANTYRQMVNALPLRLHPAMVAAAQNHADYYMLNYDDASAMANGAHGEVEGKPGFTGVWPSDRIKAAGFPWSGGSEVMHFIGDPIASVDGWMATIYHRDIILDPGAHYMGYGFGKNGSTAVDVMDFGGGPVDSGIWLPAQPFPLAYPANGQTNVPISWGGGESPDPLPPGASRPVGYPFTLQGVGGTLQVSAIEIRDGGGQLVAVHPNPSDCATFNCYALIPIQPLKADTTYTVKAQGNVSGTAFDQQWIFTTGASEAYTPGVNVR